MSVGLSSLLLAGAVLITDDADATKDGIAPPKGSPSPLPKSAVAPPSSFPPP